MKKLNYLKISCFAYLLATQRRTALRGCDKAN